MDSILALQTPADIQRALASRMREARIGQDLTQQTLARNSGVNLATLRRFERTGEVSLKHLLRLCHALGRLDDFNGILQPPPAATLAELEAQIHRPRRKRGTR
ncbi:MAG TPA: helix-turn-helix transcriptional regulator [Tepidisphaeraceae bacterium]|jgi:transcriptional regulator with XRE-family HTH domain|nr:helix-turn-helix transcriptional regulator [Tepidisphaeraceae bacterium]